MGANAAPREPAAATGDERPLEVLLISEVRFLRESLIEGLKSDRDAIAWSSSDCDMALSTLFEQQPEIILLDAAAPNGRAMAERIRDILPTAHIIVFAVAETEEEIIAWAEAGVAGYIPRTAALADVLPLLKNIVRGEQSCSGRVASALIRRVASTGKS